MKVWLAAACCGVMVLLSACNRSSSSASIPEPAPKAEAIFVRELPGPVYKPQADSPIEWRAWSAESFALAKAEGRMVFAVIGLPQNPGFQPVLDALAANELVVTTLKQDYVPVLIDGDASREMGLLAEILCGEVGRALELPVCVWFTSSGASITSASLSPAQTDRAAGTFLEYHQTVQKLKIESPEYVERNSSQDQAARRLRIMDAYQQRKICEDPAAEVLNGIRYLASMYDPVSRTFDEAGSLFPSGAIELFAAAVLNPSAPKEVRERALSALRDLLADLLPSPMFDPLDGGVFLSRRGPGWQLPLFSKDCVNQARAANALILAYQATGETLALDRALEVIASTERTFRTSSGLFAGGRDSGESPAREWLWSIEDVKSLLTEAQAEKWIRLTGMKSMGNIPLEADSAREFFRLNTFSTALPLYPGTADFDPEISEIRAKLLAERQRRVGAAEADASGHAGATFRMVSAYAAAFTATANEEYRTKAAELLEQARRAFADGPNLHVFDQTSAPSVTSARAFIYALALQAALDVAEITFNESALLWAEDLATTAAEKFTGDGYLRECPADADLLDLPLSDGRMLFDDSTAGLFSAAEGRLKLLDRPLVRAFSDLATPLPEDGVEFPMVHTDLLKATLFRHYPITVRIPADADQELRGAVEILPLRLISRKISPGPAEVRLGEGAPLQVGDVPSLREAFLPSGEIE